MPNNWLQHGILQVISNLLSLLKDNQWKTLWWTHLTSSTVQCSWLAFWIPELRAQLLRWNTSLKNRCFVEPVCRNETIHLYKHYTLDSDFKAPFFSRFHRMLGTQIVHNCLHDSDDSELSVTFSYRRLQISNIPCQWFVPFLNSHKWVLWIYIHGRHYAQKCTSGKEGIHILSTMV